VISTVGLSPCVLSFSSCGNIFPTKPFSPFFFFFFFRGIVQRGNLENPLLPAVSGWPSADKKPFLFFRCTQPDLPLFFSSPAPALKERGRSALASHFFLLVQRKECVSLHLSSNRTGGTETPFFPSPFSLPKKKPLLFPKKKNTQTDFPSRFFSPREGRMAFLFPFSFSQFLHAATHFFFLREGRAKSVDRTCLLFFHGRFLLRYGNGPHPQGGSPFFFFWPGIVRSRSSGGSFFFPFP